MSIVFASFSKDGFVSSVWCRYPHVTHRFASTRFDVYIHLLSCVFVFPSSFKCVKATFVTPSVTFHLHCDTQRWTTLVRLDPVPLHLMRRHLHQAGHDLLTFQSFGSGRLGGWLGLPFPDAWDVVRPAGCRQRGTSNLRRVACICLQTQNRAHESPAAWPLSLEFGTVNDFNGFVVKMLLLSPCVVTFVRLGSELMQVSKSFERFELWTFGNCQHVLIKTFFRVCNWSYKDKYKN